MHVNIVNTYACNIHTPISNIIMLINIIILIVLISILTIIIFITNNTIIIINVCPANIFAANLIAKLKHLITYENNSIIINIGNNTNGQSGINNFRNSTFFIHIP